MSSWKVEKDGRFFFFFKGEGMRLNYQSLAKKKISFLMEIPNTRKIDRTGTKEVTGTTRSK